MSQSNTQNTQVSYFYILSVGLTLLIPMLPMWDGPVGISYLLTCFVIGLVSIFVSFRTRKSVAAVLVVISSWVLLKDLFFDYHELREYYWPIVLQGGTTMFVAQLGVGWLYERRRSQTQLNQSNNNQLTS
jgi:hypothetical protein